MPQAAPLFGLLGIPAPMVVLRPQIVVLDRRQRDRVAKHDLGLDQLLDPGFNLDAWLAPPEDMGFLVSAGEQLEDLLQGLREPSLALDDNLERPWNKTSDQMRRALQAFSNKITSAASRRDETTRSSLAALRSSCLPQGKLQERVITAAHFPGKYGDSFVEAMFREMSLEPTNLRVVTP
jgi:uncharacterized protein YllA (UPF0747 family)